MTRASQVQEKNKDLVLPLRLFSTSETARHPGRTAGVGVYMAGMYA